MSTERKRRGRGEGSIETLPSGKFRVVISAGKDADGERRKVTKTFDRKKDAVAWRDEQLKLVRVGGVADAGKITLGEWLDKWLALRKESMEHNTYVQYEQQVRLHLKPYVGAVRLADFRPVHVIELYEKLNQAGVSAAMRAKIATTLRTSLKHAMRLQMIATNPASVVDKPKSSRPLDIEAWSAAEARQFLAAIQGDRLAALYTLALDSGMRQGELFGLSWAAVDLAASAVTVRQSLAERSGKFQLKDVKTKHSRRRIRLAAETVQALTAHREAMQTEGVYQANGLVFCDTAGNYLRKSNVGRRGFTPAIVRAGLKVIRFHDLRHTCATLLLLNGINVKAVSARLGHANAQTTLNIYAHVLPEMDEQIAGLMGRLLHPPTASQTPPDAEK